MTSPASRPTSIDIDDGNETIHNTLTSPVAAMINLSLSPTMLCDDDLGYNLASASKLIPLSLTDSASDERPLPSLHSPLIFRDTSYAGIFILHFLLALVATGSVRMNGDHVEERRDILGDLRDSQDEDSAEQDDADVIMALRSLCVVNLLFAIGWLLLFVFSSKLLFVRGSCIFSMAGLLTLIVTLFLLGSNLGIIWGIICTGIVMLELVWYIRSSQKLDFVGVFFELVVDFLLTRPALGYATCAALTVYTIWACWLCTTIGFVGREVSPWNISVIYLIFHLYWMSNVFKNIITLVTSGTTLFWYCRNESTEVSPDNREHIADHDSPKGGGFRQTQQDVIMNCLDRKVVLHYARCALSSSFGSICIGSLLGPLAHLLWNALRWARRDESTISRRFVSLRSERVEHFIRTYHKYSFVHIAGYNKPFHVAAHDAWDLIEHHGVEAIVDDDLTSRILLFGCNGWAGIMSALTASALAHASSHAIFFTVVAFALCYTSISMATQVVTAVTKTLFVCFAENPARLSQLHPIIYHRFVRLSELKSFRDLGKPTD